MTDKALAEPWSSRRIPRHMFTHKGMIPSPCGPWVRYVAAMNALDAKDAEIARLRKALIRAEGAMTNAAPNGDVQDALLVARFALWD